MDRAKSQGISCVAASSAIATARWPIQLAFVQTMESARLRPFALCQRGRKRAEHGLFRKSGRDASRWGIRSNGGWLAAPAMASGHGIGPMQRWPQSPRDRSARHRLSTQPAASRHSAIRSAASAKLDEKWSPYVGDPTMTASNLLCGVKLLASQWDRPVWTPHRCGHRCRCFLRQYESSGSSNEAAGYV